jgi:hypothetical protein
MHGGRSRAGIAHPRLTRGGRYSKHLPQGLLAAYERARVDPELLKLHDEIALTQARIQELLGSLHRDDSPGAWGRARAALRALKVARSDRGRLAAIEQLEEALDAAAAERKTWKAIQAAIDQVRRLTVAEHRRMVEMGDLIPTEDALLFVQTVLITVRDNIDDPEALRRIQESVTSAFEHR